MFERIKTDPALCNGKPCVRGMRFPLVQVIDLLTNGIPFEMILEDYPDLEEDDLREAIGYAAKLTGVKI